MLFFLYLILVIFVISIILTLFTSIEIQIKNLNYLGMMNKKSRLQPNYKIIIKLFLFEKINFFNIDISKQQFKKEKLYKSLNKLEQKMVKAKNNVDIKILEVLKNVKLKILEFNLNIEISLEDAAQNAILVGIISSIIPIIFRKFIQNGSKITWEVEPLYQNKNFINAKINCIFKTKLLHIIYTIIKMKRKGEKNDRTSNRRAYAYSHE